MPAGAECMAWGESLLTPQIAASLARSKGGSSARRPEMGPGGRAVGFVVEAWPGQPQDASAYSPSSKLS